MAGMTKPPLNHFDRSKPFYPLVMNYVAELIGYKELGLRGLAGSPQLEECVARAARLGRVSISTETERESVVRGFGVLLGPLQLHSEFQQAPIIVDIDEAAREFAYNATYLLDYALKSAASVLILAHELSKDRPWHDTGPLWEFLRHCRNAAAHGGRFNLVNGEPRRGAQWGAFNITAALHGTALFRSKDSPGMLGPGDPIRLLWDIEQAYPQMTA